MNSLEQVQANIEKLAIHMAEQIPDYAVILNTIHAQLAKQPELLYMLDDEAISKVVGGLEKFHQVEVAEPKAKKPVTAKQGKLLSADDV